MTRLVGSSSLSLGTNAYASKNMQDLEAGHMGRSVGLETENPNVWSAR